MFSPICPFTPSRREGVPPRLQRIEKPLGHKTRVVGRSANHAHGSSGIARMPKLSGAEPKGSTGILHDGDWKSRFERV